MNTIQKIGTTTRRTSRLAFETTSRGRWISVAGAVYITSWVAGLLLAPQTPSATAAAADIHAYYAQSGSQILLQSALIHGVAALAIAVLALLVPSATAATRRNGDFIKVFGISAVIVSLLQVALAVAGVVTASSSNASTSALYFNALNRADTVKLILLAGFAAAVATSAIRANMLGRWVRRLTGALVIALPVGGLAFVVDNPALTAVLYASLPLLLIWTGAIAWQLGRRAH